MYGFAACNVAILILLENHNYLMSINTNTLNSIKLSHVYINFDINFDINSA
ncbi:hypothetical protein GPAL_1249 [Glaciecola pallidula DSM 14239 = ACAM 615]|uniref:Uncharacterized protein n=1 Tax=Brumicola pallidula DSM 14239 = ACAM 615 TaxID=1121922 RepID=K6ZCP2_9ALTE|nr:hypothetical protein GPAL_1249 [Glaciecola pallidula DSM 14239 = ACAM 615]